MKYGKLMTCAREAKLTSTEVPERLVRWVRKQCEELKCNRGLSEIQTKRKKLLDSIGFKWKFYNT